mmetsp:Transcript_62609/g.144164  ORF Transcript_62609/g.144164 Transcript_62609/m.144164 type:complete len:220 (+) Transcript_62609:331-990(+)
MSTTYVRPPSPPTAPAALGRYFIIISPSRPSLKSRVSPGVSVSPSAASLARVPLSWMRPDPRVTYPSNTKVISTLVAVGPKGRKPPSSVKAGSLVRGVPKNRVSVMAAEYSGSVPAGCRASRHRISTSSPSASLHSAAVAANCKINSLFPLSHSSRTSPGGTEIPGGVEAGGHEPPASMSTISCLPSNRMFSAHFRLRRRPDRLLLAVRQRSAAAALMS